MLITFLIAIGMRNISTISRSYKTKARGKIIRTYDAIFVNYNERRLNTHVEKKKKNHIQIAKHVKERNEYLSNVLTS